MKTHDNNFLYSPMIGNFLSWFIAAAIMALSVNGYVTSPWPMVAGLFVGSIWTLWIHAYHEAERIEIRKIKINHSKRLLQRAFVCAIAGLSTHLLADVSYGITLMTFLRAAAASLYLGTITWLLFDSFLSIQRGKEWDYITEATENAARTDRLFSGHKWLWVASKVVGVIGGAYLYFYILMVTS